MSCLWPPLLRNKQLSPLRRRPGAQQTAQWEPARQTFTRSLSRGGAFHLTIHPKATMYCVDGIFHILSTRKNGKNREKGAGKDEDLVYSLVSPLATLQSLWILVPAALVGALRVVSKLWICSPVTTVFPGNTWVSKLGWKSYSMFTLKLVKVGSNYRKQKQKKDFL